MTSTITKSPLSDIMTPTECRITEMNAKGLSKKQIAYEMHTSVRTVENHFRNIYVKADVNKATELVTYFFQKVYRVPFDMSPLRRGITGIILFMAMIPRMLDTDFEAQRRPSRAGKIKSYKVRTLRLRRKW